MKKTCTRFLGVAILVCLFAVALATLLNYYQYKSSVERIVRDRVLLIAHGIDASIQNSLALGIGFGELTMLPALLEREQVADRLVSAIEVFDAHGEVLYATNASAIGEQVTPGWLAAASLAKGEWSIDGPTEFVAGIALRNNFDLTVGHLAMRYSRADVDRNVRAMGREIALIGLAAFVAVSVLVCGALIEVLRRFERGMRAVEMERPDRRSIHWQLTGVIVAGLLMALAGISFFTQRAFERELVPEMGRNAAATGYSVRALMEKAQGYGIELRSLYGVEQKFKDVVDRNSDYGYMSATDEKGAVLFQYGEEPRGARQYFVSGEGLGGGRLLVGEVAPPLVGGQYIVSLPIVHDGMASGALHIGIEPSFVQKIILETLLVLVVLVLSIGTLFLAVTEWLRRTPADPEPAPA